MISLMQLLNEEFTPEDLDESKASEEAKRQGLEYMSFGRYGKDGVVTHKSVDGKLQAVKGGATAKASGKRKSTSAAKGKTSASRSIPTRNQLQKMQNDIAGGFGDPDEYHFYATGKSTRFEPEEMKDMKNVVKNIDAEMKKVALAAKKYIATLKVMRANMVKKLRKK